MDQGAEPMNESNYGRHGNEGPDHDSVHHVHMDRDKRPYWKRAHHDWRFWVGLVLMLAAITIYVMSDDLALLPHVPIAARNRQVGYRAMSVTHQ